MLNRHHKQTMALRKHRWKLLVGGSLAVLLIATFAAFQFAIHALKGQVEKALGPQGEVKEIRVSLTGVEILGLRIKAPANNERQGKRHPWPVADQLRAERIVIVPSLMDLLTRQITLQSIRIEDAYISMLRTREGGVDILPGLIGRAPADISGTPTPNRTPGTPVNIRKIELVNGTIEFYDASIKTPPHKVRVEQINAGIDKLRLPGLDGFSTVNLVGLLKGVRQDGKIFLSGTIEFATREAGFSTRLRGVDLIALQPYLIKKGETGIRRGALDLDLTTSVRQGQLRAPGTLTIRDLELASSGGLVMGMPRNTAIAMMKNRDGTIPLKFVLEGNLNDPRFSLNENLTTRIGAAFAKSLGVSFEGLARGVGVLGSGSLSLIESTFDKGKKK
jgi:hypothetical protein